VPNKLCCVLTDAAAAELIVPAVREAGLEPVLLFAGGPSGELEKPALEHLILCSFAVIDLTTGAPGLYAGLGARAVSHPGSTIVLRAPVDETSSSTLAQQLRKAREATSRGPRSNISIDRLANDFMGIQHTKTDVFRDLAHYEEGAKRRLAEARCGKDGPAALRGVERSLGDLRAVEPGVLIDLMLSYRAVKAWDDVVRLVGEMPPPLAQSVMVQEQLAFALNRAGRGEEAEPMLFAVLAAHGPSSETWALLGRIYKDRRDAVLKTGDVERAQEILDQAIDAYRKGFEADWRDALPGINTVTLMELREPPDPRRKDLLPMVAYAVERRIACGAPDYWDYASRIELAVLGHDRGRAFQALEDALGHIREAWEPETTRNNMRLIREARERRGEPVDLVREIEERLVKA
jgi:tetratricopeptide (TPR) repeat protein